MKHYETLVHFLVAKKLAKNPKKAREFILNGKVIVDDIITVVPFGFMKKKPKKVTVAGGWDHVSWVADPTQM